MSGSKVAQLQLQAMSQGKCVYVIQFPMPAESRCVHDKVREFRDTLAERKIEYNNIVLHTDESDGWLVKGKDWIEGAW